MNRHRRIPAIVVRKVAGDQMHLIEIDGDEVRDYVEKNLLYGKMKMEAWPQPDAFASLVSTMRIAKLVAEANGNVSLVRVIDGCESPLQAILRRHEAGAMRADLLELATTPAVATRILEELQNMSSAELVCAYHGAKQYRMDSRAAQAPKSRAQRRLEERRERKRS